MRRILQTLGGLLLGSVALAILWNGPYLFAREDSWFPSLLTRAVGLGLIAQGAVLAFGAAWCLGLSNAPPGPATTGGPVLPIWGLLFLLASLGPLQQARLDAAGLEAVRGVHGGFSPDIVDAFQAGERTGWAFGVLWLVVGTSLLGTPWFSRPAVWRMARRANGAGLGIALTGLSSSAFCVFLWFANGLTMEAASRELSLVAHLGVVAGSLLAVAGAVLASSQKPTA